MLFADYDYAPKDDFMSTKCMQVKLVQVVVSDTVH